MRTRGRDGGGLGNMSEPWCIYIDMEGFSTLYAKEDQILWSLGQMMLAIHRIGTHVYPSPPDRLFAHQTGDGFVIQSDFNESSPLRALSIAVVVLRHVASTGRYARAAISEGEIADIVGCYPKEVRDDQVRDGVVSLGEGLMTLFSVMGMGLIRSVKTNKIGPRGPLLLLDPRFRTRLPKDVPTQSTQENDDAPLSVDWVHIDLPLVHQIQAQANLSSVSPAKIEETLVAYCRQHSPRDWICSIERFLHIKCS
jgi:hypothetical protein